MHRVKMVVCILSILLLLGCHKDIKGIPSNIEIIASEKTLPPAREFHELAFERTEVPYFSYLMTNVEQTSKYNETWDFYRMEEQKPDVNFENNHVLFIGGHESGSCPNEISGIQIDFEQQRMTIVVSSSEGPCTDDAAPRTFVIRYDKEVSEQYKEVMIVEGDVETTIPIETNKLQ